VECAKTPRKWGGEERAAPIDGGETEGRQCSVVSLQRWWPKATGTVVHVLEQRRWLSAISRKERDPGWVELGHKAEWDGGCWLK
jgi:hypothetical protein